jgi:hypothetical protein
MAREFVKIQEWEDWVPPMDGERDLYQSNPDEAVIMELRFLTKEQRDHYQRISEKYQRMGAATSRSDVRSMRQMFEDNVRNVRNYSVDGAPVTTGGELFDVNGDVHMIAAVAEALTFRASLDRGLAKKLRSGSDSTRSAPTTKSAGAAPAVTPPSNPDIQGALQRAEIYDYQTQQSVESEVVIGGQTQSSTIGPEPTTSSDVRKAS